MSGAERRGELTDDGRRNVERRVKRREAARRHAGEPCRLTAQRREQRMCHSPGWGDGEIAPIPARGIGEARRGGGRPAPLEKPYSHHLFAPPIGRLGK